MKPQSLSKTLSILIGCMVLCMSCHRVLVPQFAVELTQRDGTRDSYDMTVGSLLLVNDGEMHVVAKAIAGDEDELELEVTRYTITPDTVKGEYTIQKSGARNQRISLTKSALLDPTGNVQVNLQSMAKVDTGKGPKGACLGNCCEAKCFSTFCCADPYECKDVPCDCKPPAGCVVTHTALLAKHFFELYRSGKEMMVVKKQP